MHSRFSSGWVHYALVAMLAALIGSALTLWANTLVNPSATIPPVELTNPSIGLTNSSTEQYQPRNPAGSVLQALSEARAERAQLTESITLMSRQIDDLESDLINLNARNTLEINASGNDTTSDGNAQPEATSRATPEEKQINSMIAAGVDPITAQQLQASRDQFQLERLELLDLAEREGRIDSEQFADTLEQFDEQRIDLRKELGDAAYDRYLFELGRNNRVAISSVISGSAADAAGLMAGDIVVSYANVLLDTSAPWAAGRYVKGN